MAKKKSDNASIDVLVKSIKDLGGVVSNTLDDLEPKRYLSTGMLAMDQAISSVGGIPSNCCIELYGPNSTGKTSFALQCAMFAQQANMKVYYINAERAINKSIVNCFSKLNGETVDWIDVENGEAAINIMTYLLKTQPNIFIINDSIPACLPSQIQDKEAGQSTVGALARLFSPFMPEAKKYCNINNSILMQLNQIRHKIGPMARGGIETPGGESIKFYSDIRIELKRRFPNPEIKSGQKVIGHYISAKMVKNRWGVPFQIAELPLWYGHGFDSGRELLDFGIALDVIDKKGSWISFYEGEEKLDKEPMWKAHGLDQGAAILRKNGPEAEAVRAAVLDIIS